MKTALFALEKQLYLYLNVYSTSIIHLFYEVALTNNFYLVFNSKILFVCTYSINRGKSMNLDRMMIDRL